MNNLRYCTDKLFEEVDKALIERGNLETRVAELEAMLERSIATAQARVAELEVDKEKRELQWLSSTTALVTCHNEELDASKARVVELEAKLKRAIDTPQIGLAIAEKRVAELEAIGKEIASYRRHEIPNVRWAIFKKALDATGAVAEAQAKVRGTADD